MTFEEIPQDYNFEIHGKMVSLQCSHCLAPTDFLKKTVKSRIKTGQKHMFCSRECKSSSSTARRAECLTCGNVLVKGQYSYCSNHCSSNRRDRRKSKFECNHCGVEIDKKQKFCSMKCSGESQTKAVISDWLSGKTVGWTGKAVTLKPAIRKYIFDKRGTACSSCGWDGKHPIDGKPLTQIDHKDGNAKNCSEENLRILCPNCHAMTETFGNRNKESSRFRTYRE